MSAFQLGQEHLGAIAKWAIRNNRDRPYVRSYWNGEHRQYDFDQICHTLAAECFRSVRSRYPSGPLPGPADASDGPVQVTEPESTFADLSPVDVLKACKSYGYQSCETNDWEQTEAYALVERIKDAAIHALPGFDESPAWDISYTLFDQQQTKAEARKILKTADVILKAGRDEAVR